MRVCSSPIMQLAAIIAETHHERWDGTGYPNGLKEDEIPLAGMIMNISDQYDALRSKRPYKPGFSHDETFRIISEGDGRTLPTHFAPPVLEAFRDTGKEFDGIYEEFEA